ncbi:MAG: VWA domain-containing protein, partial [Bryobacteraceae bacterium]
SIPGWMAYNKVNLSMKLRCLKFLAVFFAVLCGLLAQPLDDKAPAQQASQDDQQNRFTLDVTRVNLLFTVSDKKGRFVTDLTKDDFDIIETKKHQNILEFTAESNLPLRLAILVDTSNSSRERFHFQQEAAIEFINSVVRPHQDKAIVVSFDSLAEMVTDLTDNVEQLNASIRGLRPGGGTSLYDAIFYTCRDKLMLDRPLHKFRRAMVILSDGEDNDSRYSRDQALEMAQKADVVVYTISTNVTRVESEGDKVLKYFAQETGGLAFFPFKVEDLEQSFENIANELRHQYNILYRPEPLRTDGLYHTVTIRVKGRKDLVVRARHGYYAPKL